VTGRAEPVEISPEPTPEERDAILAALAQAASAEPHPARGAWARPLLGEDEDEH
jgi:hypothetical protein